VQVEQGNVQPSYCLLIEKFLLALTNSRSLYSDNLSNLFKLIKKISKDDKFDKLFMNVASNLKTLDVNLFSVQENEFQK